MYAIVFDFDCLGEPPRVEIVDEATGYIVLRAYSQPTIRPVVKHAEYGGTDWDGTWSSHPEDWEPPELAKQVVDLLNSNPKGLA
jgi:hypothetical protein